MLDKEYGTEAMEGSDMSEEGISGYGRISAAVASFAAFLLISRDEFRSDATSASRERLDWFFWLNWGGVIDWSLRCVEDTDGEGMGVGFTVGCTPVERVGVLLIIFLERGLSWDAFGKDVTEMV